MDHTTRRRFIRSVGFGGVCALAGCVTFSPSIEVEPEGQADLSVNESDDDTPGDDGPGPAAYRPVIHELDVQYDDEWLTLGRRYEVPDQGNEFQVIERWRIFDAEGNEIYADEDERDVEGGTAHQTVWVPKSWLFIDRWNNNLQSGEYTVELVVEDPTTGNVSEPAREVIVIDVSNGDNTGEAIDQPVIHELDAEYNDNWLNPIWQYEIPDHGEEFHSIERWTVLDSEGNTVFFHESEREIEGGTAHPTVQVPKAWWAINRELNNIQHGNYTVELVVVGPTGNASETARVNVTLEE